MKPAAATNLTFLPPLHHRRGRKLISWAREREREREQRTEVKGANIDTDKSDLPLSPRLVKLKFLALALNVLFQGQNSEFRERLHTLFLFARSGFLVVGGTLPNFQNNVQHGIDCHMAI